MCMYSWSDSIGSAAYKNDGVLQENTGKTSGREEDEVRGPLTARQKEVP